MKDNNYITIQGWMVNRLKLAGNELMVYAIIYGFSQDENTRFKGSIKYISESVGASRQAVYEILKKLEKKGLLEKSGKTGRGITFSDYKAVILDKNCQKNLQKKVKKLDTDVKKLDIECQETLHHNITYSSHDNIYNIAGSAEPVFSEPQNQALELSELLLTSHRKEYPDFLSGKNGKEIRKTLESWAADIEKLIRIDKKQPENIRRIILWIKTKGNFWFSNIESGHKLREKYDRMWAQMQEKTGPPPAPQPSKHQQNKKSL